MNLEPSELALKIKNALDQPEELEILYQDHPKAFETAFLKIWPAFNTHSVARCWHARLKPKTPAHKLFSKYFWIPAIASACCTQWPWIFGNDENLFFIRNAGIITIPFIWMVFFKFHTLGKSQILIMCITAALCCLSINTMPADTQSQSFILSCIHIPLLLWVMGGFWFHDAHSKSRAFSFFRFTTDFILFSGLMALAGFLFSGLCVALFNLIKIPIESFYFKHMALPAGAVMLCAAANAVYKSQNSVSGMAQRIAKWFSPAVMLALCIYVPAVLSADKNPFSDRDVLVILNFTLIAILAVVLCLLSGLAEMHGLWYFKTLVLGLIGLSVLLDGIVLSAVSYRIASWGLSANKCALLLENSIIFSHLLSMGFLMLFALDKKTALENNLRRYIWIYSICFACIGLGFYWVF